MVVEQAKRKCICVNCGFIEYHTELTIQRFLKYHLKKCIPCVQCNEYGLVPFVDPLQGR
jgi:hypothetical protein